MSALRVFIGFDRNEVAAYHTLCNSILRNSSKVIQFTPLYLPSLIDAGLYWRKDQGATDFSFSRFLVPYLAGYKGEPVLFMDCDMVLTPGSDIADLFTYIDPTHHAVSVCKHDYRPTNTTKFKGNAQRAYPRKLWSAVMLINPANQRVKNLTPKYINEASGAELHQFDWIGHESRIGEIPETWHYIPNHSKSPIKDAKCIHYTEGGPWFTDYRDCQAASLWISEHEQMSAIEA